MPSATTWELFSRRFPRSEVVFFCQIIILFVVIVAAIVNLTLQTSDIQLWTALLSSSIGYILPNPRLQDNRSTTNQENSQNNGQQ